MNIKDAARAVETAIRDGVPKLRVYTDPGATVDPPGAVVGPPRLTWSGYGAGPNTAEFIVWAIVPADDRALDRLWDLVPQVAAALEASDVDITVTQANPSRWPAGGTDLPAYEISTEVAL